MDREAMQANWRAHFAAERGASAPAPPAFRNIGPTLYLTQPFRVPWRGRMWLIPPVGYPDALRLLEFQRRSLELSQEAQSMPPRELFAAMRRHMADGCRLVPRMVQPMGRIARLFWPIRWRLLNPFRALSETELRDFIAAFSMRRTTDPDRPASETQGSTVPASTTYSTVRRN